MKIYQSRIFEKAVTKLSKPGKLVLDEEIKKIVNNPFLGNKKKGDLSKVFVHKFKVETAQYLVAYRVYEEVLELIMIGPHENYYRDLKNYLDK